MRLASLGAVRDDHWPEQELDQVLGQGWCWGDRFGGVGRVHEAGERKWLQAPPPTHPPTSTFKLTNPLNYFGLVSNNQEKGPAERADQRLDQRPFGHDLPQLADKPARFPHGIHPLSGRGRAQRARPARQELPDCGDEKDSRGLPEDFGVDGGEERAERVEHSEVSGFGQGKRSPASERRCVHCDDRREELRPSSRGAAESRAQQKRGGGGSPPLHNPK